MKKFLILSLVLVMSLSTAVFAAENFHDKIDVAVKVPPFVTFDLPGQLLLSLDPGSAKGTASAKGTITTNFAYSMLIVSKEMSEESSINDWFHFKGHLGTETFEGNPGFESKVAGNSGIQNFGLTITVGDGINKEWYKLPANEYTSAVYLTIYAPVN